MLNVQANDDNDQLRSTNMDSLEIDLQTTISNTINILLSDIEVETLHVITFKVQTSIETKFHVSYDYQRSQPNLHLQAVTLDNIMEINC